MALPQGDKYVKFIKTPTTDGPPKVNLLIKVQIWLFAIFQSVKLNALFIQILKKNAGF